MAIRPDSLCDQADGCMMRPENSCLIMISLLFEIRLYKIPIIRTPGVNLKYIFLLTLFIPEFLKFK